jgi:hypothetical protein
LYLLSRPTATEARIRLAFWQEYERTQMKHAFQMQVKNIYAGVCTHQHFYTRVLQRPEILAWMLMPPASYQVAMEEALNFGVERLREILELPIMLPNGKPDTSTASLILKTVAFLDMRVKGAIVQKNLNVNVSTDSRSIEDKIKEFSMDELDRKIARLEKKEREPGMTTIQTSAVVIDKEDVTINAGSEDGR